MRFHHSLDLNDNPKLLVFVLSFNKIENIFSLPRLDRTKWPAFMEKTYQCALDFEKKYGIKQHLTAHFYKNKLDMLN